MPRGSCGPEKGSVPGTVGLNVVAAFEKLSAASLYLSSSKRPSPNAAPTHGSLYPLSSRSAMPNTDPSHQSLGRTLMYLAHLKQSPVKGCTKKSIGRKEERRRYKKRNFCRHRFQRCVPFFFGPFLCPDEEWKGKDIDDTHNKKHERKKERGNVREVRDQGGKKQAYSSPPAVWSLNRIFRLPFGRFSVVVYARF